MKNDKKKYTYAQRVAYHKGFGVGSARVEWGSPEYVALIARCKTKEERVSFQTGMLDGQTKVGNKIGYAIKNNKISQNTMYHWKDYWALHDE